MKVRVEEHVRARGRRDVKRGAGGIRDVEFAVQLLQLVHGRRDPRPAACRARWPRWTALAEGGYVAEADAERLADSYRFLRRLEHRLQLVRDLQTHDLPEDPASLRILARSLGLDDADALRAEHERHAEIVRGPARAGLLPAAARGVRRRRAASGRRPSRHRGAPGRPGLRRPAAARTGSCERLIDPATRMGKVLGTHFPLVAPGLALAANPDRALVRFSG